MAHVVDGHLFGPGQPCFGCSPDHPHGFRLKFSQEGSDVVTHFTPTLDHQGPPGIMHGGLVATLADEVAAWAPILLMNRFGFTVSFEAKLQKAMKVLTPIEGKSRIVKDARRLVDVEVHLRQNDHVGFKGTFRFALLDEASAEKLLERPLPASWKQFCR